jgi:hypothetical protein
MHALRKNLCWLFGFSSLVCLQLVVENIWLILQPRSSSPLHGNLVVAVLYTPVTAVFAVAWWTVWRDKPSGRHWGITASLIVVLMSVWPFIFFLRSFPPSALRLFGILLLFGVVGLIAFWRRYDLVSSSGAKANPPVAGDGTSRAISLLTELLAVCAGLGIFYWWDKWLHLKGVPPSTTYVPGIVIFALILLVIVALHELGHTLAGISLGMKLRAFLVGPLQWRIRNGRWAFDFKLAELLPTGGGTGMVPATADFSVRDNLLMITAGPFVTLATGSLALWLAISEPGDSPLQLHGVLALFAGWSLLLAAINVIPFQTVESYSDGAAIYQLLIGGPMADYHRTMAIIGSSLVTPMRARDFDIAAIQRASNLITQGVRGMLLRLYAYMYFLDQGKNAEALSALQDAEAVYNNCASAVSGELHAEFVFANAYLRRDPVAAREWWNRMAARKPTHFKVDYWKAFSALRWIEGDLKEANEAWEKSNTYAQELPNTGAYEFDRHCCSLLRRVIDEAAVKSTSA